MKINIINKTPTKVYFYSFVRLVIYLSLPSYIFSLFDNTVNSFFNYLFMMLVLFGLPIYFYVTLKFKYLSFIVSNTDITVKSGVFSKKTETIPLSNIQNIVENTSPLMSLFGITKIKIWDASSKLSDSKESITTQVIIEKNEVDNFKTLVLNKQQTANVSKI